MRNFKYWAVLFKNIVASNVHTSDSSSRSLLFDGLTVLSCSSSCLKWDENRWILSCLIWNKTRPSILQDFMVFTMWLAGFYCVCWFSFLSGQGYIRSQFYQTRWDKSRQHWPKYDWKLMPVTDSLIYIQTLWSFV